MNISLSWANYALITGVCLCGYYIVIGLVYYRKDISLLLHPKDKNSLPGTAKQDPPVAESASFENLSLTDSQIPEEALPVDNSLQSAHLGVQDFVDEIEAYTQACGRNVTKEALASNLRKILQKYPALMDSSLQYFLLEVMSTATKN